MTEYIKKSDAYSVTLHKTGDAARAAIEELQSEDVIPVDFIWKYVEKKGFEWEYDATYGLLRIFLHGMIKEWKNT